MKPVTRPHLIGCCSFFEICWLVGLDFSRQAQNNNLRVVGKRAIFGRFCDNVWWLKRAIFGRFYLLFIGLSFGYFFCLPSVSTLYVFLL